MTGNNHKNRGWRRRWTCEPTSRVAVHESGVIARVSPSQTDPDKDRVTLDHTGRIDPGRYDLGRLAEEATRLYIEGHI